MTYSRSASRAAHRRLPQQAWALEPRMMFDAAAVATAEAVVAATDTAPGVTASGAEATVTIDESSGSQSVDMFSGVSVTLDNSSESLSSLVITVDSSGGNQALMIDGSTISLETGSGVTTDKNYFYSVAVSGSTTTVTIALDSVADTTASDVATLIDGIAYSTLDNTVESGTVTVTLSTLSDNSDTAQLGISSTITIDSQINVAPVLSDDGALEAAESITVGDLGDTIEVVYSGDGNYAYAAGEGAISIFSIDDGGRLTLAGTLTVDGMSKATEMAISADNRSIYVIDGSSNVYVFSVGDDGKINAVSTVSTDNGDVTGGLAIADDDAWVYVGTESNGVVIYSRDAATGALTYVTRAPDDNSREGVIATAGDYVYVIYSGAGLFGSASLSVYQRNDDGSLTTVANVTVSGLDPDFDNIDWANPTYTHDVSDTTLAVSADGQYLYIAAPLKEVVLIYQFSDSTLTLLDTVSISGVSSIALSNEDGLLYAVSADGGISVFSVAGDGALTLSSSFAGGSAGSDIAIATDGLSILVAGGGVNRYTSAQTLDQGEALTFAGGLTLKDSNYDVLSNGAGNYNGASITVSANVDGGSYGFADGNGLSLSNGVISLNGSAIATLSASDDGVLTVTFTAETSTVVANQVLQQLTYANAGATAGSFIQLSVLASDAALASSAVAVTLRVNALPQVNTDASTGYSLSAAVSETPYSFTLFSGLFGDADGDSLTWSVSGLPEGLIFDPATRTLSGSSTEIGTFTLTITVTDASGASASLERDLIVEQIANRAPVVNEEVSTTLDTATENTTYSTTLDSALFSDADSLYGDSLTWSVSGLPDGFTFDAATLIISGSSSAVGDYTVTVTATDESGVSSSADFTLRVITQAEANNSAPSLVADAGTLTYASDGSLSGFSQYVNSITLSDDGTVLVIAASTSNNAGGTGYLYVYSRNPDTGELALAQTFTQGAVDDGDAANGIEVDGLSGVTSITYSADGGLLYVTGYSSTGSSTAYSITVFGVSDDGSLSLVGEVADLTEKVLQVAVAGNGDTLYALSATTLYSYSIGNDGLLTVVDSFTPDNGFGTAVAMRVDDNGTVYVLSGVRLTTYTAADNGNLVYAGQLTRSGTTLDWFDADGNVITVGTLSNVNAFNGANAFVVSDDGYIYLTTSNGFLTTLHYDSTTNVLSLVSSISVYSALSQFPHGIAISGDGTALYVVSGASSKLVVYAIGEDGVPELSSTIDTAGAISRLVVSDDGNYIYGGRNLYFGTPLLSMINAAGMAVAYTEGGTVNPAGNVTLSDADYDALNGGVGNYNGASITLAREGGANAADSYSFSDGNGLTLADGVISLNGAAIGTFVSANGTLSVMFTTDVTTATANLVLRQIAYTNSSADPSSSITLTVSVGDQYTANALNVLLTVTEINDAPSVAATGNTATFTENGEAVILFDGVMLSTGEAGQAIAGITLSVSGLSDGESETLTIDGSVVALVEGSGVTVGGYSYSITLDGGTATVVISDSDGIAVDDATALIAGLSYANQSDDPTAATRIITLTSVQDDGGTANGGSDTVAAAIAASVTVVAVNDAPVIDATAANVTYATSGSKVSLFSEVTLSTVESGQTISAITFTVSGLFDGGNESLTVSGSRIALVAGSGTLDNGYAYSVTLDGDTATVTIVSDGGIAADAAAALIEQTRYANLSNTQTAGVRTISLSVRDSGGQDNGGSDTVLLEAAAAIEVVNNAAPELSAAADYTSLEVVTSLTAVSGLGDIAVSTLTAGGDYLYVAGSDGGIAIFSRNTSSGELTLLQTLDSGISSVLLIEISDDGGTVSLLGANGDSIAVFSRDSRDGGLTLVQTLTTENVVDLSLSADGGTLYVVDGNYSGLLVYTLDADSGQYALSQSVAASTSSEPYLFTAVGIEVVGDYVYVITDPAAETVANTLIVYQRATDGTLSAVAWLRDGAAAGDSTVVMSSPVAIAVAGDGGTIYIASEDGVAAFSFDAASGALSYVGAVGSLSNVTDIALSGDDGTLYVTSSDGSISRYKSEGGSLMLIETLSSASAAALADARSVATGAHGAVVVIGSGGMVSLKDALTQITFDYHEQGTLQPFNAITLSDADYDALADGAGNYNGAVITLVRDGGANGDDGYGFVDGNGLTLTDGTLYLDGAAIADFTSDSGTLTLTFTADVTGVTANRVLQQISYTNASDDPGASIRLAIAVTDAYAASVSAILALNVTEVNDAPVLNATPADTVYVEGAAAALFNNASVSTVEDGQSIAALTITVSGVVDAAESLLVDGTTVTLTDGVSVTTVGGLNVTVAVDQGTATLIITSNAGLSQADAQALIDGLTYANTGGTVSTGERVISLTAVRDDGGTAAGGENTTALSIAARVNIVNSAPQATDAEAELPTATRAAAYSATLSGDLFSDVNGDTLSWRVDGLPDGLGFDPDTRTISGRTLAVGSFELTVTVSDGQGETATRNLTLAVDKQPVSPVFLPPSNAPGMMERGWDARQEEERPEEAIGGASRPVTRVAPAVSNPAAGTTPLSGDALSTERYPLVNGEMDYAATPWQLDPVMATLMPPLEAVDFSSLRTTPENARLGQQIPQSDGPDAKVAFSAQLQQEQSAYQAQKEYDELLNALSQLTENTASPAA